MYPPVPSVSRQTTKPCVIDGVTIPAGMIIHLAIMLVHYNADVWENPEVRWSDERLLPYSSMEKMLSNGGDVEEQLHKSLKSVKFIYLRRPYDFDIQVCSKMESVYTNMRTPTSGVNILQVEKELGNYITERYGYTMNYLMLICIMGT